MRQLVMVLTTVGLLSLLALLYFGGRIEASLAPDGGISVLIKPHVGPAVPCSCPEAIAAARAAGAERRPRTAIVGVTAHDFPTGVSARSTFGSRRRLVVHYADGARIAFDAVCGGMGCRATQAPHGR